MIYYLIMSFVPIPYLEAGQWFHFANFDQYAKALTGYTVEPRFEIVDYRADPVTDNEKLVMLRDPDRGEIVLLINFYEHPVVDLTSITIDAAYPKKTPFSAHIVDLPASVNMPTYVRLRHLLPNYYFPWLLQRTIGSAPSRLLIRGLSVDDQGEVELKNGSVRYFIGKMERVAFERKGQLFRKYAVPSVDFRKPFYGMVAVAQDHSSGRPIFIIRALPISAQWDQKAALSMLSTIDFSPVIPSDPFAEKIKRGDFSGVVKTEQIGS